MLIFLIGNWGQSSPWRFCYCTCSVAVVINGCQCAKIMLRLPQRPLDILGILTVRQWPRLCYGHLYSSGCGETFSCYRCPSHRWPWLTRLTENGTIACLADKLLWSTAIMRSAASCPLPAYSPFQTWLSLESITIDMAMTIR